MKKVGMPLIIVLLLFHLVTTASASETQPIISFKVPSLTSNSQSPIIPAYAYTDDISATLSFSNGKANCFGIVTPSGNDSVSIQVALYKSNGSNWDYIASWSGSATGGNAATASGSVSVSSGTYKVTASGNNSGKEYPSASISRTN